MDMSAAIIPKSDQINADDLIAGPMTITITGVDIKGGQEQPVSIHFDGSDKVFRPCKSMSRVFVTAWGPDAKKYAGRSVTLYRDPTVKWGGLEVGGIRISHLSHIDEAMTMVLTATKGSRKPFKVLPLKDAPRPQPRSERSTEPEPDVAPNLPPDLQDFVDFWDGEVASADNAARLHTAFSSAMKTEDWTALRDGHTARAQALKKSVTDKVAQLKGGG